MQITTIKYQAVLFGSFNFPPVTDTTIKLLQAFASLGFMPQVHNLVDTVTGLSMPRISLTQGVGTTILFADDRIDIISAMPVDLSIKGFIDTVVDYVSRLDGGNLQFHRIALILDSVLDDLTPEEFERIRTKLLPSVKGAPFEWTARWVLPQTVGDESYNVCFEAVTATGLMLALQNRLQPLSGLKIMHDVSTAPQNLAIRFSGKNLGVSLSAIADIIAVEDQAFNQDDSSFRGVAAGGYNTAHTFYPPFDRNITLSLSALDRGGFGRAVASDSGSSSSIASAGGLFSLETARRRELCSVAQREFVEIARLENFEYGYTPPSERYVQEFSRKYPGLLGDFLQGVALDEAGDSQIMIAVLNALGSFPYDAVRPFGQILAVAAVTNPALEVKEAAIRVYETWEHPDGARVLATVECPWGWLDLYRKQVIADLSV
ncbi:hypothetical protein Q9L58_010786 [Maublancomyces gigas]|uniref:Uncharacterized protein n=1 Tax=Discina gigas TaxID=1032678 RepID=A0ABR3G335_9PEZI